MPTPLERVRAAERRYAFDEHDPCPECGGGLACECDRRDGEADEMREAIAVGDADRVGRSIRWRDS